jgi:hypothetical protein
MKFRLLFIAQLLGFGLVGLLEAENPGEFEDVQWGKSAVEPGFDLSWTGKPDRYYFVEQSPDLSANSWSLFPYAVKGDGSEVGVFLDPSPSRFFFRLLYTDEIDDPLLLDDFNDSGFSNRDELDMGANPFDGTDTNGNGVPDHIEAFWANEVPDAWKQAFVDDPNKALYDPDNTIAGLSDVSPGDDYDGDGRSNLREYLDGSDPTDYYSQGALTITPQIQVLSGDNQYGLIWSSLPKRLTVIVTNSATGAPLANAPVTFSPTSGSVSRTVARTIGDGRSAVTFRTPDVAGVSMVDAVAGSAEVQFVVTTHVAGIEPPAAPSNFTSVAQPDGSKILSWTDNSDNEDVFVITLRDSSGQWVELGTVPANQTTATINSDGTLAP